MWDPYAEFESATLPNGLTVHAAHWLGRPWQAMGFLVHSGAAEDPVGLEGLAHFTEHLVASGTTKVPARSVMSILEDYGGDAGLGCTGYERTKYTFFAPLNRHVMRKVLGLYGNMLLKSTFDEFVERERSVILSEYARSFPFQFKYDGVLRMRKAVFAGHFLARSCSPLGNPDSIRRITQSDLQLFYDTHYTPQNISVVSVGGMKLSEVMEHLAESPFGTYKDGVRRPSAVPIEYIPAPSENRFVFEVSKYVNVPCNAGGYESMAALPGTINREVPGVVAAMIADVLNEEVREKRMWTYSIGPRHGLYRDLWLFSISCGSFKLDALDSIEGVIEDCIASLHDKPGLFEQKRLQGIASLNMLDSNGRHVCFNALDELGSLNRIVPLSDVQRDLERMTMEDVRAALEMLRPERRWTCITKP